MLFNNGAGGGEILGEIQPSKSCEIIGLLLGGETISSCLWIHAARKLRESPI